MQWIVRYRLVGVLAVAFVAGPQTPGVAAFPGANGRIVFASYRDSDYEIYSIAPDGTGETRLTNSAGLDGYPVWSPDGQKIVFVSGRDGNDEIYLMNADGSGQTRLTNDSA